MKLLPTLPFYLMQDKWNPNTMIMYTLLHSPIVVLKHGPLRLCAWLPQDNKLLLVPTVPQSLHQKSGYELTLTKDGGIDC